MPKDHAGFADYAAASAHLYHLKSSGVRFGVDRMARFSAALGHPERQYPVIHVAGTNGKGSVSAMLESILRAGGKKTGLYTSPHLVKLGERVQVNRRLLSEEEIIAFVNELEPLALALGEAGPDERPSFFEFMTGMAFLQFARHKVDVGIIEVGLGGRLDATNVVQPALSIITSIGFDHMEQLGYTLAEIAREKAGIIKPGRPVVMGRLPAEAETVVRAIATERQAPLYSVREVFGEDTARYPHTHLEGDFQRWNAATATLAARLLPETLRPSEADIENGLARVQWPGRWQRLQVGGRRLILDASHNPEGATVLENNLLQLIAETGRPPVVVAGMLGEFRAKALLAVLARHTREIYLVSPQQERACTYEQMVEAAPEYIRSSLHRTSLEQIFPASDVCALGKPNDTILITGSIYLLGEVLAKVRPENGSGEGHLQDF